MAIFAYQFSHSTTPVFSLEWPGYIQWTFDFSICLCTADPLSLSDHGDEAL